MKMQFKIRCSAIGEIMTNGRGKGEMGKTALTYCETWVKEQLYGRRKEFSNKYTDKGQIVEDNALELIGQAVGLPFLIKNERYIENDIITGTPDVILGDCIVDVKSSWDCFTFPLFSTDIPNSDYEWQLQGYMILADKPAAKLIYALMDTPLNIVEREAKWKAIDNGTNYDDELKEAMLRHSYSDIPDRYKIKVFDIQRRPEAEAQIRERVVQCQQFIDSLTKNL